MKTIDFDKETIRMMKQRKQWEKDLKSQYSKILIPIKPLSREEMNKKIEKMQQRRICDDAKLIQKYFPSEFNQILLNRCENEVPFLRI